MTETYSRPERQRPDFSQLHKQFPKWSETDLEIVWERNDEIQTVSDLKFFLYFCQKYDLDPVTGEVVATYRWNGVKGKYVLTPIVTIAVMRKRRAPQCDGLEEFKFTYDPDGKGLISASGSIYRKGCSRPFSATVFFEEYAATDRSGKLTNIWRTKPHLMLAKCLEAQLTRLGFYDLVGELLIEEEVGAPMPTTPVDLPANGEDGSAVSPLPMIGIKPTSGTVEEESKTEPAPENAPAPAGHSVPPEPSSKTAEDPMFEQLMQVLGVDRSSAKSILGKFTKAYLGVSSLPTSKDAFREPLRAMLLFAAGEDGVQKLLQDPAAVGRSLSIPISSTPVKQPVPAQARSIVVQDFQDKTRLQYWAEQISDHTWEDVCSIMEITGNSPADTWNWFNALDLIKMHPIDIESVLRVGKLAPRRIHEMIALAANTGMTVAELVALIESRLPSYPTQADLERVLDEEIKNVKQ